MELTRRFPPPWSVEEQPACFVVHGFYFRSSDAFRRGVGVSLFLRCCSASGPGHLHLPLLLALWTGQRQGDLLRLPWSAYDGTHIRLKQSKTGARVLLPVGAPQARQRPIGGPIRLTP
jgi:hypothetical protein